MKKIAATLFGLCVALTASACAPTLQNSQWTGAENSKQNKVLYLRQAYDVHFEPGKDALSAAEQDNLAKFLNEQDVGMYDEISLAAGSGESAKDKTLASRRATAVSEYLRTQHLKSGVDTESGAPSDHVTITVGRYVVVPPNCPDWRKPSEDDPANSPSSNLGCATTTNLGMMVADPHDLISGKKLAPTDGEYGALGVQRYRAGVVKIPHDANNDTFEPGTGINVKK